MEREVGFHLNVSRHHRRDFAGQDVLNFTTGDITAF